MLIVRSLPLDLTATDRTVMGRAFLFNTPSPVSDDGGRTFYKEQFAPGSATKTVTERVGPLPLMDQHEWSINPKARSIGDTWLSIDDEGVLFHAELHEGSKADEALAHIRSGAKSDVSIGFRDIKPAVTTGDILTRTEIAIDELSIAQTGTGQHQGATIMLRALIPQPKRRRLTSQRQRDFDWLEVQR